MILHFLRHATAQDIATSDAARELTKEGREEARVAGQALVALGVRPSQILTSPLVRARQTAELVAHELKFTDPLVVAQELLNDTGTGDLMRAIRPFTGTKEIVLVGHMPSLAEHVLASIGAKSAPGLSIGKGGLASVDFGELRAGTGRLLCLLRQKQLRAIRP